MPSERERETCVLLETDAKCKATAARLKTETEFDKVLVWDDTD